MAGKELALAMLPPDAAEQCPEWLPESWDAEFIQGSDSNLGDKQFGVAKERVMSGGGSDRRRRRGTFRRGVDARAIVPAMYSRRSTMDRPEWLPDDWTMELKKRSKDCQSSNRIDRYYICPLSGKRLRSRIEVMHFLNNEVLDLPASSSPVVGRTTSLVVSRTSPRGVGRTLSMLVAGERPEWLPEGWSVEFRKRRFSNTIDKYYICPSSGKKLRSRVDVMRFLNNEISDRPARSSSAVGRADIAPSIIGGRPKWLPYGWKVEYRPRRFSSHVDKYYMCQSSGIKLRSRRDVMRFLNNEVPNRLASGSAKASIAIVDHGQKHTKWRLDQRARPYIEGSRLHLCARLRWVRLDHALLTALVERWRPETNTFHMRQGEMTITLQVVAVITCLPIDGEPIYQCEMRDGSWGALMERLLGQDTPLRKAAKVKLSWLRDTFTDLPEDADDEDIQRYARAYLLHMIGTLLVPDPSKGSINLHWLTKLDDFEEAGGYSWGIAVLAHLYAEFSKVALKQTKALYACGLLLQVWSWERMYVGRPRLLHNVFADTVPYVFRWNTGKSFMETAHGNLDTYRDQFDTLESTQVTWEPYGEREQLPALCREHPELWRARVPIFCWEARVMHAPDRVMRQFGLQQHIPSALPFLAGTPRPTQPADVTVIRDPLAHWMSRVDHIVNDGDVVSVAAYMEWYWGITRRWIFLRQQPPFAQMPRGPIERQHYYMNPINGHRFRSKKDVFRHLENKEVRQTAFKEKRTHTPDVFTLKEEFLPLIEYKKSKVRRTVVRKRLFGREEPIPDAKFEFASPSQKAASTTFGYPSALDNGASPFQIEWYPNLASHEEELQRQPSIKMLPCSMNKMTSLVGLEGGLHVADSNPSEEEQFELTKKQSQSKSCSIGEECQNWPAIKILGDHENRRIPGALMRLEGERLPIPDANLLEEKKCAMRQPQSQLKRHCSGEEFLGQPSPGILQKCGNEKLSDPLMQLECQRRPEVSDVNLLEKKQLEMTEKLSQLKRRIKPKRRISGEEMQGKSGLTVQPWNEKLLESLMQLEGNRLPVPDANMSVENKLEPTQKQTEPKRCSIGEEFQGQLARKVFQKIENENLSESPMEIVYERHVVPDANLAEVEKIEMNQKLCQLKTRSQPKRHGTGEKRRPAILHEPGNEKLTFPLRHLEGKRWSVPDSNLSEETQFELSEGISQFKRRSQSKRHGTGGKLQVLPANKTQPAPRDEKLSEPLMQQEGGSLPVLDPNLSSEPLMLQEGGSMPGLDANLSSEPLMQREGESPPVPDASLSEEKQFEPTENMSQPNGCSRVGPHLSKNTEASKSATKKQPSKRKRKAKTADTIPIQDSKPLVDVTAKSVSNAGTANRSRGVKSRKIEQAPSTVPKESDAGCCLHQNNACITDELQEKLERLKPFVEQASQVQQADQPLSAVAKDIHQEVAVITNELREKLERLKPFLEQASRGQQAYQLQRTVPRDLDANSRSHQKDLPETEEIQEKFRMLQPFVEHASKELAGHPLATLPFGEAWLDPCLEFAFKTLTSDFPVLEDVAAIQDYFSHQLISSDRTNTTIGSIVESNPLAFNAPRLGKVQAKKDCQRNRRPNL